MKEEMLERLDAVTAEHLWGIFVRQAVINGISYLLWTLAAGALAAFVLWKARKELNDLDSDDWTWWLAGGVLMAATFLVLALVSIDIVPAGLFNPEYLAWKEIRSILD